MERQENKQLGNDPITSVSAKDKIVFVIVTFIFWFSLSVYVPILPTYIESIGGTYFFIGIVLGSYGLMQIIVRIPLGIISDAMKVRRRFVIFGLLTAFMSCIGFMVTDELAWVLLFRTMAGISASTWVVFTVLYASYFLKTESIGAMGTMQFATVAAQLTGMGLSGLFVSGWGIKSPFFLGGIVGLMGLVLSFFIKEVRHDDSGRTMKMQDLKLVIREPKLLKISFLSMLGHCILFITIFGFTPSYALKIGASESQLSYLVMAFLIPHAIASVLSGNKIVPVLGQWPTLLVGFLGSSLFTLIIPLLNDFVWLCITQAINGFVLGLIFPLMMGMSIQSISYEKQATAMGVYQAFYALGIFIGPLFAGWLNMYFGLAGGFYLASIFGFVAVCLSVLWGKRSGRQIIT